jgi:hypothetical protein
MKKIRWLCWCLSGGFPIVLSLPLLATTPTAVPFLEIVPSVRAFSLAGNTALLGGPEAIGANPAGLIAQGRGLGLYTTFHNPIEGSSFAHIALAKGFSFGSVGLTATTLATDTGDFTDPFGASLGGSSSARDTAFALAFAGRLPLKVNWGAALRAVRSDLGGFTSNTSWGGDFGLKSKIGPVTLGLSTVNLGQEIRFISQSSPLPTRVVLDAALPLPRVILAAGVAREIYSENNRVSLGAEVPASTLVFRGGYALDSEDRVSAQAGGTDNLFFGLGAKLGSFTLDYGVGSGAGQDRYLHRFSLSARWGKEARP